MNNKTNNGNQGINSNPDFLKIKPRNVEKEINDERVKKEEEQKRIDLENEQRLEEEKRISEIQEELNGNEKIFNEILNAEENGTNVYEILSKELGIEGNIKESIDKIDELIKKIREMPGGELDERHLYRTYNDPFYKKINDNINKRMGKLLQDNRVLNSTFFKKYFGEYYKKLEEMENLKRSEIKSEETAKIESSDDFKAMEVELNNALTNMRNERDKFTDEITEKKLEISDDIKKIFDKFIKILPTDIKFGLNNLINEVEKLEFCGYPGHDNGLPPHHKDSDWTYVTYSTKGNLDDVLTGKIGTSTYTNNNIKIIAGYKSIKIKYSGKEISLITHNYFGK